MSFLADQFGASTQQDILTGGDGAKLYGWNLLNSANATVIDVNISNAGQLSFGASGGSTPVDATFNAPYVYQNITGDFDVDTTYYPFATSMVAGLIARDPAASAGEDWVGVESITGDQTYSRNTTNSSSSSNTLTGTIVRYHRIVRSGNDFTMYAKGNAGDSWSVGSTYTRSDFASTIQVGVYNTNNGTFDYFQGTNSGGAAATINGASTLPILTSNAVSLDCSMSSSATLPHFTSTAIGDQTGNYCDTVLPLFDVSGSFAGTSDCTVTLPLFISTGVCVGSATITAQDILPMFQNDAIGISGPAINCAATLPQFVNFGLTGADLSVVLPLFETTSDCVSGGIWSSDAALPLFITDGQWFSGIALNAAQSLPHFTASSDLATGSLSDGAAMLPIVVAYGEGFSGETATGDVFAPMFVASGVGWENSIISGTATFPLFFQSGIFATGVKDGQVTVTVSPLLAASHPDPPTASISITADIGQVYCVNTETGAVTQFTEWPYNSILRHNEKYIGACTSGLFQVYTGRTDSGFPINAYFKTGFSDLGFNQIKRLTTLYMGLRGVGDIEAYVITDDDKTYVYSARAFKDNNHQTMIKTGRGLRGRYYCLVVKNVNGTSFEIDDIDVQIEVLPRRVYA